MTNDLPVLFEKINNVLNKAFVKNCENTRRGESFNIVTLSNLESSELFHSSFIAELLKPNGSHGQGDRFLKLFLDGIPEMGSRFSHPFDASATDVQTEYVTAKGRIDIMVKNSSGQAIIIENKIYAEEQPDQIKRYQEYAFGAFGEGNYVVLYLTLNGAEAETADENENTCLSISYRDNVLNWIMSCIDISSRLPGVREVLIQYEYVIKLLTNQVMEDLDKTEILDMLIEKPEVAKAIYSLQDDYVIKAVKDYLFPKLEKLCAEEGIELHGAKDFVDCRARKEIDCTLTPRNWKFHDLLFGFESTNWRNLYVGVRKKESNDKGCSKFKCLRYGNELWCGGWEYLPSKFSRLSYDTVPEIISGEFAEKIFELVKKIKAEAELEGYSM